jgi:diketogulonate reductase-like aldo/keto reductase
MNASTEKLPTNDGAAVPRFLYGTAWKEDATQRCVELAIQQGFRGIDTANQRRHYHEAAVGQGIAAAIGNGTVTREQLFIQTKFTFRPGQDHRLPYDPEAPIAKQVEQSFASSLEHLGIATIDSYVLHGPMRRVGLIFEDWEAWRAMEAIHQQGKTRLLGVSNVSLEQLELLCGDSQVSPRFVQNRCFANQGWDYHIRQFCLANDIVYQGFSLLTANPQIVGHSEIAKIAKRYGRTACQIIFRFAIDIGMLPLTGTTDAQHMHEDLRVADFQLETGDVQRIERLGVG